MVDPSGEAAKVGSITVDWRAQLAGFEHDGKSAGDERGFIRSWLKLDGGRSTRGDGDGRPARVGVTIFRFKGCSSCPLLVVISTLIRTAFGVGWIRIRVGRFVASFQFGHLPHRHFLQQEVVKGCYSVHKLQRSTRYIQPGRRGFRENGMT